jgi:Myo-inositol-1-phosphate synthase
MIKLAVVGVGNCASALIQGIFYYRKNNLKDVSGLMYDDIGGYKPYDIQLWLLGI